MMGLEDDAMADDVKAEEKFYGFCVYLDVLEALVRTPTSARLLGRRCMYSAHFAVWHAHWPYLAITVART
jgi:hypothetical protein